MEIYWVNINFIESSPLPGVCSDLADIFIISLFNVDLALNCCLGCLKRRNVRQGPYNAKRKAEFETNTLNFDEMHCVIHVSKQWLKLQTVSKVTA